MPSEFVYFLGMMVRTTGSKKPLGPQQCTDSGSCSDHWNLRDEKLIPIVMSEITEINVPDSQGTLGIPDLKLGQCIDLLRPLD